MHGERNLGVAKLHRAYMLYHFLSQHQIDYQKFDHPPLFTCEDAKKLNLNFPGMGTKNLFLRDDKGKRHVLVVVPESKTLDLKELGRNLEIKGLGFASAERLKKYLGVEPGSVTIFGLLHDQQNAVEVIVDEDFKAAASVLAHPLVNTASLLISRQDFEKFILATGHSFTYRTLPVRSTASI